MELQNPNYVGNRYRVFSKYDAKSSHTPKELYGDVDEMFKALDAEV